MSMKADVVFGLENAGWPALLVDGASTVCRANPMAVRLFGAAMEGEAPRLSAIWLPENSGTAEQFLARWERSPAGTVTLKLREKMAGRRSFRDCHLRLHQRRARSILSCSFCRRMCLRRRS